MTATPNLALDYMVSGESAPWVTVNNALNRLDAFVDIAVIDRDLTAPPGGEATGDAYLVGSGATDAWAGHDGEIAVWFAGWLFLTPKEGKAIRVKDENVLIEHDGSAWRDYMAPTRAGRLGAIAGGITAGTTQTQGQVPLTSEFNVVATCANANDVVTLPAAIAGLGCTIWNRGAQTLQVFPASGDKIDGGSTDASVTIAAAAKASYRAIDAAEWLSV